MVESYKGSLIEQDGIHINKKLLGDFLFCNGVLIPEKIAKQEEVIKYRIRNILGRNTVSDLLILLSRMGLIKLTDNSSNYFEKEKEIKILDIEKKIIVDNLIHNLGANLLFEGTINDMYYDTINGDISKGKMNSGKKSSLRIRHKALEGKNQGLYYCTIKRKDGNSEDSATLRDCYEEEFEIFNPLVFHKLLQIIDLIEYRMKVKSRTALALGDVKFDFDKYEGIPDLLEIEAPESSIVEYYIEKILGLKEKERLNGGTKSLFKYYGKEMITFNK